MLAAASPSLAERVAIKINDEPSARGSTYSGGAHTSAHTNYRHGSSAAHAYAAPTLAPVHPAPFAGPDRLRALVGRCFARTDARFSYSVCPFHNATQSAFSMPRAAPKLIGRWGRWAEEGHVSSGESGGSRADAHVAGFTHMLMPDGDRCSAVARSTLVLYTGWKCRDFVPAYSRLCSVI